MIKEIKLEDIKELFKRRDVEANKGDFGKVGILGGSIKYSGAVKLATISLSALRSGCGLVRVIIPKEIIQSVSSNLLEQTMYPYESLEDIKSSIQDLASLAIGMGWDKSEEHLTILKSILKDSEGKIVIDADGLNTLVGHLELVRNSKAKIVLTPHIKEFSRLTGYTMEDINRHKEEYALKFAQENHVILVLKGHTTIVTDGIDIYLCKCGSPGMATSGSGDVLSGILSGMLGYLEYNILTISAGVMLNGLAGEIAEDKNTDIGMIASDTIKCIPEAIKEIRGDN